MNSIVPKGLEKYLRPKGTQRMSEPTPQLLKFNILGDVPDCFLTETINLLESLLVSWQLVLFMK